MPELHRPAAYLDRLRVAERAVKSASYRHDPKLAIREICEGVPALIEALIAEEEKRTATPDPGQPDERPAP
jgi:hypothetical protein